MKIKRLTKDDLNILTYIIANLIPADNGANPPAKDHLEKLLTDDRTYLLTAITNGIVVGYTLAYQFPSLYASTFLAYLYDIEVSVNYRRQGIGRLLIKTLITHLKADGVTELWLGTATENTEGQRLFSSTGAEKSDETFTEYTYYLD